MWLVINIGRIECGVSSNVVGVFADKEKADRIATALDKEMSWREGGQNAYEVFPLPPAEQIAEEYRDALSEIVHKSPEANMAQPARILSRYHVVYRPNTAAGKMAVRQWCVLTPNGDLWRFRKQADAERAARDAEAARAARA